MISEYLVKAFTNAAKALDSGLKDTGFTSNGLRKLDFVVRNGKDTKVFTALSQNPNKLSTPAKLARDGHKIYQIRDNDKNALLGFVDLDEKPVPRFNSFENIPNPVEFTDIEESLGSAAVNDVQISAARTATPIDSRDLEHFGETNWPGRDKVA